MPANTHSFDITQYKKKLGDSIVLFKSGNTLDVFYGDLGWNNHARFTLKRTNRGQYLNQVQGNKLPNPVFKHVILEVNK